MATRIRISLVGTNALEGSPDPRNYILLADADNVLIKEQSRGTLTGMGTLSTTHSIGYRPHFYAYGEISTGRFQIMNGYNLFGQFRSRVDSTKLYLENLTGSSKDMRFFVFYDDIPV